MATTVYNTSAAASVPFDFGRAQTFMQKAMGDFISTIAGLACAIGDRLDFFNTLSKAGPLTADELAASTATDVRLVTYWLGTMTSAGYVNYDAVTDKYGLPPEHASLLLDSRGAISLGGGFQMLLGFAECSSRVLESFRTHNGVAQSAYSDDLRHGMERMSAPWFEQLLVTQWLPLMPSVLADLRRGIRVADIGCGAGRALIAMARAFPASSFTGYDIFAPALERARENAAAEDLTSRVTLTEQRVEQGLPERYDLITMFNSLHDIADHHAAARSIYDALSPGGTWLILESSCSGRVEDNTGPIGTILYGTSLFYNAPVSIANGGNGSGALLAETQLRDLCEATSFDVRRLSVANPMHALYAANPR